MFYFPVAIDLQLVGHSFCLPHHLLLYLLSFSRNVYWWHDWKRLDLGKESFSFLNLTWTGHHDLISKTPLFIRTSWLNMNLFCGQKWRQSWKVGQVARRASQDRSMWDLVFLMRGKHWFMEKTYWPGQMKAQNSPGGLRGWEKCRWMQSS